MAIVTGAASGIGAAAAARLTSEGATTVFVDIDGNGAAAKPTRPEEPPWPFNATSPNRTRLLLSHREVLERCGKIDVMVNAAAQVPFVAWDDLTFEEWRRVLRVNLDGLYLMCRASSDAMRRNGYGRIVSVSSNSIFVGTPNMAHYVASKGAC